MYIFKYSTYFFCDYYSKINKSAETIRAHIIVRTLNKTFISHALHHTYIYKSRKCAYAAASHLYPKQNARIKSKMSYTEYVIHVCSNTSVRICHMCVVCIEIFW